MSLPIGDYKAHLFFDGIYPTPITDLLHSDPAERERVIARLDGPIIEIDVNCFGLDGPDGLILIDAGTGEHWGPAYGRATGSMRAAGFQLEQVKTVLLTHIHGDHALGLLDKDAARFPNADVRLPRGEADYYGNAGKFDKPPEGCRTLDRLKRAYGDRLTQVESGPVLPGIEAIALPGHTPGHTGYLVRGDDKAVLFWGDVVHIETLQLTDPLFGFDYDVDFEAAQRSRQFALETAAREGWYIGGGHVKGFRRIERQGAGFSFRQE